MTVIEGVPDVWLGVICDYLSCLCHASGNILFRLYADPSRKKDPTNLSAHALLWYSGFVAFFLGGLLDILALSLLSLSMWVCNGILTLPLTYIFAGFVLGERLRWWQWVGILVLCVGIAGTLRYGDHNGVDVTDKIRYSMTQVYGIVYIGTMLIIQLIAFVVVQIHFCGKNWIHPWAFLVAGPTFSAIQASWSQLLIKDSFSYIKDVNDGDKFLHPGHLFFVFLIISCLVLQLCAQSWMFGSEEAEVKVVLPIYQTIVVLATSFNGFFVCDENPEDLQAFLSFGVMVMVGLFLSVFPEDGFNGTGEYEFSPSDKSEGSIKDNESKTFLETQKPVSDKFGIGGLKDPGGLFEPSV